MVTDLDPVRVVRAWLDEQPATLPDYILVDVLDHLPKTKQRHRGAVAALRIPLMRGAFVVSTAAAVVVIVVLALLIGRGPLLPVVGPPVASTGIISSPTSGGTDRPIDSAPAATPKRTLTVAPTIVAPPQNDSPPGVVITGLPFVHATNVAVALIHAMEPASPCAGGSGRASSVWYSYNATDARIVQADTFGSDYDTIVDVWRGSLTADLQSPGFEKLQLLACNDDDATSAPLSAVIFATEAGQGYVIRVSAKDQLGSELTFHLLGAGDARP